MYAIELSWINGERIILPGTFGRREDALWALSKWRQMWDCRGEPFRIVEVSAVPA